MIREGQPEVTLRYISESPKRLAISTFTEGTDNEQELPTGYMTLTSNSTNSGPQHSKILRIPLGESPSLSRYQDGLCQVGSWEDAQIDDRERAIETD